MLCTSMIVECHACGASYNISDDRVRGRRVRVRCKSCNEAIIIDGTEIEAGDATGVYSPGFDPVAYGAPSDDETRNMSPADIDWREAGGEETRVVSPQKVEWREPITDTSIVPQNQIGFREAGPGDWVVNLSDTDQRAMSPDEIIGAHRRGLLDDAFFWREGMADWRPAVEIPELRSLLGLGGTYADDMEETTQVVKPLILRRPAQRAAGGLPAPRVPPPPQARAAVPMAPRQSERPRAAERGAVASPRAATAKGGADLFANVDVAGADDGVLASSSLGRYESKATGARNESSVLFSLNTLKATSSAQAVNPRPPATDQTAADILGLNAAGGLPGMSATAALFAAPAPEPVVPEARTRARIDTTPPMGRKKATPWPLALGVAVVAVAAVSAAVFILRSGNGRVVEGPALPATTSSAAPPSPMQSAAAAIPVESANPALPEPSTPEPSRASTAIPAGRTAEPARAAPVVVTSSPSRSAQKPVASADLEGMKAAVRPETKAQEKGPEHVVLAEDPQDAPPFDAAAAKAALGNAAAQAGSCKQADGPTGKGQVQVTFAPTGNTTAATVTDGTFGGTPVGGCVAKVFRAAKVPAFSGAPVTVSKSFVIE